MANGATLPIIWEVHYTNFMVNGECNITEVGGDEPITLIRTNQDWLATFTWETTGTLNLSLDDQHVWHLKLLLERYGEAEASPGSFTTEVGYVQAPHSYQGVIQVPAGSVEPGEYKLAVSVTLVNGTNDVPFPVAGLAEGPLVQFYTSPTPP
jgi:hypothetical protein